MSPTKNNIRPCKVDGRNALFHDWARRDIQIIQFQKPIKFVTEQLTKSERCHTTYIGGLNDIVNVVRRTVAIIEYEDGTVAEVEPAKIMFVDGLCRDYDFGEDGENEQN